MHIKNYFCHSDCFADLLNGLMFQERCVIDESHVQIVDANVSTTFLRQRETMVRILIRLDDAYCLVGLEHQSYRDKSMFQRNMEYDMLTYLKQYHLYESHHQKINGVMTLTLYYGEEKWNYAKSYLEMMNKIIQGFENYVNVNFYPLIEVAMMKNSFKIKTTEI